MNIEKQASPASRRIMEILKRPPIEQRQAIVDRLAEYSAAGEYNEDLTGRRFGRSRYYDRRNETLPVPTKIIEKLKSSPELATRTQDRRDIYKLPKGAAKSPHDMDLARLRDRYATALRSYTPDAKIIEPAIRKNINQDAIVDALKGELHKWPTQAPTPEDTRKSIIREFKSRNEGRTNLLAQFPKEQPGVGEMYFTPHLFETDLDKRKEYMANYKPKRDYVPDYNEDALYETVINKHNVTDPSKRLVGGKYYIPGQEGAGVLPASLPTANEGYIYKGGQPASIMDAKNLKRLSGEQNAFFSGIPTVSARYASNVRRPGRRTAARVDPADMPVQPAGFRELRRYLYGDMAKRKAAISNAQIQTPKFYEQLPVRPDPVAKTLSHMQQFQNNLRPMFSEVKQNGASLVGKMKGLLGGKFRLGKAAA